MSEALLRKQCEAWLQKQELLLRNEYACTYSGMSDQLINDLATFAKQQRAAAWRESAKEASHLLMPTGVNDQFIKWLEQQARELEAP